MSQQELLRKTIRALEAVGIEYMVTGSIVSSYQGEPRATHDIDFIVAIRENDLSKLINAFSPGDFFCDEQAIADAIRQKSSFNIIDMGTGVKLDFWLLTDTLFDITRFKRRISQQVMDMDMKVSTPEDTILMKLKWAAMSGGSEKQFNDAVSVFELQRKNLDINYMEGWIKELHLEELWETLKKQTGE